MEIRLYTGDLPNAGTTARVYLRLTGPEQMFVPKAPLSNNQLTRSVPQARFDLTSDQQENSEGNKDNLYTTPRIWLEDGAYERNKVALFSIDLPVPKQICPISELMIGHDNSGSSPAWFLDKVRWCVCVCRKTNFSNDF
ncbi:unnamed protein product [Trichobilharzia regenti]|nr:unnamed protein product [Trichobilharzia regenti]